MNEKQKRRKRKRRQKTEKTQIQKTERIHWTTARRLATSARDSRRAVHPSRAKEATRRHPAAFQGHPSRLRNCSVSRWPFLAAAAHESSFHARPCSWQYRRTAMLPVPATEAHIASSSPGGHLSSFKYRSIARSPRRAAAWYVRQSQGHPRSLK